MNKEQYDRIEQYFSHHPMMARLVTGCNHGLTLLGFVMFPLLLVCMYQKDYPLHEILFFLAGSATAFLLLSIYRKKKNSPRPYELLPIHPLIAKDSSGNSFPSRHVFSCFLIAVLWLYVSPPAGVFLLVCSCLLAFLRVIGGVHFIRDVLAGAAIGIISGAVCTGLVLLL